MKKTTHLLLALVAGIALAQPTFAEDNANAASQDADKPKPEAKADKPEKAKPAPPKPVEAKPEPRKEKPETAEAAPKRDGDPGHRGPRPGAGGPDREKMQARMQEIRELREAGKHEEAERKIAEARKEMGSMMRERSQDRRGPGGPPPVAEHGPKRPPMDREGDQKPEGKKPDQAKPEHDRPGPPSPEKVAAFREKIRSQMGTLQKLRQEGKHDEVAARMEEMRKNLDKLRAEHDIPRGHGGPPWLAEKSPKPQQADRDRHRDGEKGKRDRSQMKRGKSGKKAQWAAAAHRRAHFAQRAQMMRAMQHHRAFAGPGPRFHARPHAAPFGRSGFYAGPRGPMPHPSMAFRPGGFGPKDRGGFQRPPHHRGKPQADRADREDGSRMHHRGKSEHGQRHHGDRKPHGEKFETKEACEHCQKKAEQES